MMKDEQWKQSKERTLFDEEIKTTFKSCEKDKTNKGGQEMSTLSFRATKEMVGFIVAGDAKIFRPQYHVYFGMSSYPVMWKNKHLHDKVKSTDEVDNLTFEKRGNTAVKS